MFLFLIVRCLLRKCMGFGHRFVSGYCSEGEHNVRPYIGFVHSLDFGLNCNFGYTQLIYRLYQKNKKAWYSLNTRLFLNVEIL